MARNRKRVVLTCWLLGSRPGEGINSDAVLGYIILVLSYAWKAGGLFDSVCNAYHGWFRYPVERRLKSLLAVLARRCKASAYARERHTLNLWLATYRMVVAIYVPYHAISETLASFSSSIWLSCLGLAFGTIQIYVPRHQVRSLLGPNEDQWGFGQLVPLILLCQPLSAVWEHLVIQRKPSAKDLSRRNPNRPDQSLLVSMDVEAAQSEAMQQQAFDPSNLLQHLDTENPSDRVESTSVQQSSVEEILLKSRLFRLNVYLTQPAIITISVVILFADAFTKGQGWSGKWFWIWLLLVGFLSAVFFLSFCLSSWSSLGRLPRVWQDLTKREC